MLRPNDDETSGLTLRARRDPIPAGFLLRDMPTIELIPCAARIIVPVSIREIAAARSSIGAASDTFRQKAAEAQDAERATSSEMRDGYEQLAKHWDELISEIVAVIIRQAVTDVRYAVRRTERSQAVIERLNRGARTKMDKLNHYRVRAQEIRKIAKGIFDHEERATLLDIAREYEEWPRPPKRLNGAERKPSRNSS
jgi:hypothetical protein